MNLKISSVAFLLMATSAQASADPVMVFYPNDGTDISGVLANLCLQRNILVTEQDATHVICAKEMSGLSGALTQAMVGNSYSTTPNQIIRFSITKSASYWSVQAVQWVETQMAFGQVRRVQLDGKKHKQAILSALLGEGFAVTPPPPPENLLPGKTVATDSNATATPLSSIADEIEKLANLRQKGIITEQEFQAEKEKLLNRKF